MKKLIAIIGARPQFIKHFAFDHASKDHLNLITIHTGQHYDDNMSKVFFDELKMSRPTYTLKSGRGNHGAQTGTMLIEIEKILELEKPDSVLVYGDTNSTLAGALAAAKLHIPVIHIEAGVRSYNKTLPEEVNRLLTDHISSLFFVPTEKAINDLKKEGITENVYNVGDIMKDVLDYITENTILTNPFPQFQYYYATVHRPYNTDSFQQLSALLNTFQILDKKVVFAVHPRTLYKMKEYGIEKNNFANIVFIEPQSYSNNISYLMHCECVITDSGGLQKEAYWLRKKCITLRSETEWIETLHDNWNTLVFEDIENDLPNAINTPTGEYYNLYSVPESAKKMVDIIKSVDISL